MDRRNFLQRAAMVVAAAGIAPEVLIADPKRVYSFPQQTLWEQDIWWAENIWHSHLHLGAPQYPCISWDTSQYRRATPQEIREHRSLYASNKVLPNPNYKYAHMVHQWQERTT